jgi:hypothetical protein
LQALTILAKAHHSDQLQAEMGCLPPVTPSSRKGANSLPPGQGSVRDAERLARPVLAERLITELNSEDRNIATIAWLKEPLRSWLAKGEASAGDNGA